MIQGAEIAGTLIYFIPAGVNFFFSGKPRISFIYIINDITCFFEDTGTLLNATDPESKSVLELFQRKEGEGMEGVGRGMLLLIYKPELTFSRRSCNEPNVTYINVNIIESGRKRVDR
jgi:hypothetical protein